MSTVIFCVFLGAFAITSIVDYVLCFRLRDRLRRHPDEYKRATSATWGSTPLRAVALWIPFSWKYWFDRYTMRRQYQAIPDAMLVRQFDEARRLKVMQPFLILAALIAVFISLH